MSQALGQKLVLVCEFFHPGFTPIFPDLRKKVGTDNGRTTFFRIFACVKCEKTC